MPIYPSTLLPGTRGDRADPDQPMNVGQITNEQWNTAFVDENGTTINASAAELNETDASAQATFAEGNHLVRVAQATYEVGVDVATAGAHSTGVSIPADSLILGGMVDVQKTFTDGTDDSATIAISVQTANNIITATSVATGTTWDQGLRPIIPLWTSSTAKKTTAAAAITVTTAVHTLTAGKMTISLFYIPTIVNTA